MMIKPGISELSKCADSRYTLVTMAAKRARMIGENGVGMVKCECLKPVSMAVNEIAAGKVGYVRNSYIEEYRPATEWRPDRETGGVTFGEPEQTEEPELSDDSTQETV